MSREAKARDIAAFLNDHYFSPMAEIIHRHSGTTDKHIGDSIMAVFGAPVLHADDALQAVRAAVDMQEKAAGINLALDAGCGFRLNIGIGISTGKVFSGILGSIRKREFTSIGMAVNMASRLQRLAKAGEILICGGTRDKVFADFRTEALPPVAIKGIEAPITIYKVNASGSPYYKELSSALHQIVIRGATFNTSHHTVKSYCFKQFRCERRFIDLQEFRQVFVRIYLLGNFRHMRTALP